MTEPSGGVLRLLCLEVGEEMRATRACGCRKAPRKAAVGLTWDFVGDEMLPGERRGVATLLMVIKALEGVVE